MSYPLRGAEDGPDEKFESSRGDMGRSVRASGFAPARREHYASTAGEARATLRYWPIVLVDLGESLDDLGVDRVIDAMESAYSRGESFIVLVDATRMASPPNTTHRLRLAHYGAQNEHRSRRYSAGTAYAISNALVRGALNAMQWVFRPPTPSDCLGDRHEAADWCVRALDDAGVDAKEAAYRLRCDTNLGREFEEGDR